MKRLSAGLRVRQISQAEVRDVAGTVTALGDGVNRFKLGDRVYGMPRFPRAAHGYAEYVTSPSRHLARIPDSLDLATASATRSCREERSPTSTSSSI